MIGSGRGVIALLVLNAKVRSSAGILLTGLMDSMDQY